MEASTDVEMWFETMNGISRGHLGASDITCDDASSVIPLLAFERM
jgi:hypothetical protein